MGARLLVLFEDPDGIRLEANFVPGGNTELHALVVSFYRGNKDCPTWDAGYASAQSWAAVSCVIRWNGSKFTYKPL